MEHLRFCVDKRKATEVIDEFTLCAIKSRGKLSQIPFFCGILLIVVTIAANILGNSDFDICFGIGLILTFLPKNFILMVQTHKKAAKENTDLPRYDFSEEDFFYESDLSNGNISYDLLTAAYETKNLFLLENKSKQYYVVPKDSFSYGSPEEFAAFIAEKLGCDVPYIEYKPYTPYKKVMWITLLVLTIACGFFAKDLSVYVTHNTPKQFSCDEFAVTLSDDFYEFQPDGGTAYALTTQKNDVIVWAWSNPRYLVNADADASDEDFGKAVIKSYAQNEHDLKLLHRNGNKLCFEYTEKNDNVAFYYYTVIEQVESRVYVTEFTCARRNKGKYKPLFEKWAKSITIENADKGSEV